jgi:short-subunit dehydrogenase
MQTINYFQSGENNCFYNKNIIITGATGGIGTILVKILFQLKANLFLISHDEKK